jgi:hypothetical protein
MARVRKAIIYFVWLVTCCVAPADDGPVIREALLTPGFDGILRADPTLLQSGGANLIETDGTQYFVAVGFASVLGDSPAERLRQLQVARIRALKVASDFIGTTIVTSEQKFSDTTTVTNINGVKSSGTQKLLEETTVAKIKALIKAPPVVGTWKSGDGKLYFYAIGTQIH